MQAPTKTNARIVSNRTTTQNFALTANAMATSIGSPPTYQAVGQFVGSAIKLKMVNCRAAGTTTA